LMSVRRLMCPSLLVLCLGGCASWHQPEALPSAVVTEERPRLVRVTRADGRTQTLERPVIVGDTIVASRSIFNSVSLSDVQRFEVPRFSATKTFAFVAAQAGLVMSVMALIVDLLPHYRGL
jgi:hypothetical protein